MLCSSAVTTSPEALRAAYDAVARPYAERFARELDDKPLDRALLCWFGEMVRGAGPVADLGCGPGHVTRWLRERGADAFGVDASAEMVAVARELHRDADAPFRRGDFLALDVPDASLAGAIAFHAYVHLPPAELPRAFRELARVLRPRAPALVAFHVGLGVVHLDAWLDRPVALDWHLFPMPVVVDALERAGLSVETKLERAPYPGEHPTTRGYVLARRRG